MTDLLAAALELHAAGYCPVRASINGSKAPLGKWKTYQDPAHRPSVDELRDWFGNGHPGIGIITGQASGNAELLEFEGRAVAEGVFTAWSQHMVNSGLGGLLLRLLTGYLDATPGGGWHVHYRVAGVPVPGNTKLAERPSTAEEIAADPETRKQTFIETRGEGGFVITAPSNGATHPSGRPWQRKAGGPGSTPVLTAEEHDALMTTCRALDRMPRPEPIPQQLRPAAGSLFQDPHRDRPGDEFNAQYTWPEILEPRGWTVIYTSGGNTHWRRPGKSIGTSATTRQTETGDYLYVFSTSTPFDAERAYDKFGAYAVLEHGGDFTAAARALRPAPVATSVDVPGPTEAETNALYMSIPDLERVPKPTPLIEGVIDGGSLFAITGRDGVYKSFLAFDWLASLATGEKWFGYAVAQGPVLYVLGEGVYGTPARAQAWQNHRGVTIPVEAFTLRVAPVNLFKGGPAYDELKLRIEQVGYRVVVFDTLQRMSSGADLNTSRDASVVIERLDTLRKAIPGGAVGFVAHTGKSDIDARGSSVLEDDVDIVWRLKQKEDENGVTLTLHKRKDGPDGTEMLLDRQVVPDSGSLVLRQTTRAELAKGDRQPGRATEILSMLALPINADGMSSTGIAEAIKVRGKGVVVTPLNWLHQHGLVAQDKRGTRVDYRITQAGRELLSSAKISQ